MSKTTHAERTAAEPRQYGLHAVKLCRIQRVSPSIRLLTLALPYAIKFLPGQWLDVHIPTLPSPGGFTITSPPSHALLPSPSSSSPPTSSHPPSPSTLLSHFPSLPSSTPSTPPPHPSLELAIQHTSNPPAQWLWQPEPQILNSTLQIRVGGSFTWPPEKLPRTPITRVVFIAGGVGINPFMSMISALREAARVGGDCGPEIRLLYGSKMPKSGNLREVLFFERLVGEMERRRVGDALGLRLTGAERSDVEELVRGLGRDGIEIKGGRISDGDLEEALGESHDRDGTVVYICGPGPMVDEMVGKVGRMEGMSEDRVYFEKWW